VMESNMNERISSEIIGISPGKSILGIDAGSTRIKGALWTGSSWTLYAISSGVSYEKGVSDLTRNILESADLSPETIVATGYGRKMISGVSSIQNEIGCHAKGAMYLAPGCRTVIDIGGQDAKVISLREDGKVSDFAMNDKCAAGTGRFLSIMADALSITLADLGTIGTEVNPLRLSSMCTVFAESEIIGLLSQGYPVPEIVAGINDAIARRTLSLASRLTLIPEVIFTGGVSANSDIVSRISALVNLNISVPQHAEFSGAIGAVLSVGTVEPWQKVQVSVLQS
ncbi:MAG TPA: acyl-CoA dehydratase activase, partial [Methanospirillum sp.]|uniref:acyl-CoA dehydratase activase n=1 Tax=Methanospirillum sp. TaxID=45200 RepID=UPI002B9A8253